MEELVATLGKALIRAMKTDVWHQVLRVFATSLADEDSEAAGELRADLRAVQRQFMEDRDHDAPHAEDDYLVLVTDRLRRLLGEKPELRPALARVLDRELFSFVPGVPRAGGENTGATVGFTNVAGQVVIGGMTQNINRDQVRDA